MAAHILDLLLETALFGFRIFIASGLGFMVIKLCIRIINHKITGMADLQAEIHIIEGYRQFFQPPMPRTMPACWIVLSG